MKYIATLLIGNSFFELVLTNHDDDIEQVEKDATVIARAMGMTFLYINRQE